jgi:hypothetical protein
MELAALASFAVLFVAWLVAPDRPRPEPAPVPPEVADPLPAPV